MADLYPNYAALAAARQIGVDYRLLLRSPAGSRLAHLAVHGGGIEPGTLEVAEHLAGSASRFYGFDSMLADGVTDLRLGNLTFDEPQALGLIAAADYVIAWHGVDGADPVVYVSGLDTDIATRLRESLEQAGFTVETAGPEGNGSQAGSITNKGARAMGVQVELSLGLRQSFFQDFSRAGRETGQRTGLFYSFVTAVQVALTGLDVPGRSVGTVAKGRIARPVQGTGSASGDYGIPTLAPLSVDGMPLQAVTDALRLASNGSRQVNDNGERFWSSQPRNNGDRVREVFEFALSSERPVNRLSFRLARFPQRAWAQWRDRDGVWHPLLQARTGSPVQISITDSLPAVIPSGVVDNTRLHPQHFGAGHWVQQAVDVVPVTANRFRIVMTRLPSSSAPVGVDGQPVPYSLGVQDALVSYRVASLDDLPWLPQEDAEHSRPIAGNTDLFGSQTEYLLRRNRASNLMPPAQGVWRCAPQPVPNAVVSLYLDVRDPNGQGQVIDRLYLEPVTSGPSMNVYYSDESAVPERFASPDTPLAGSLVRIGPEIPVADTEGVLLPGGAYLDIDNRACQFDPRQPFLLGMVVHPQFTSADAAEHVLCQAGALSVRIKAGVLTVGLGEYQVELEPVTFAVNNPFPLAVAYDGTMLSVRTPWQTRVQYDVHLHDQGQPQSIRLSGLVRLRSLILTHGRAADIDTIEQYWAAPAAYALAPGHGQDAAAHTSASAIVRMDASLITAGRESVCPWGLIGGTPVDHQKLVWTPIPQDFVLRKGLIKFRPIKARHLKLEFTNLQPTIVTPGTNPVVTANFFPTGDSGGGLAPTGTSATGAAPAGARVATEQGAVYQFADARNVGQSVAAASAYTPTEALYAPDPLDAQALRRSGQRFPYMPLPATTASRFSVGRHRYHSVQMVMDTKVGYTVALGQVLAYLADPVAERDTEQYIELFHDTLYLSGYTPDEQGGWKHTGSAMVTDVQPPWQGSRITSKALISKRRVLAVQLAAQTSDAVQLVADPDFDDPSLHFWRPVGDAFIASSTRYAATIGLMAEITRGHALSTWGILEEQYPTWGAVEESDPAPDRPLWSDIENAISEADHGGIESLHPVTPAPGGRLYAAVRVYTPGPLRQPLRLQLINGDGRILAEAAKSISAAQVAEWYVGTTIRTDASPTGPTWDSISLSGTRTWQEVEALGTWGDISQTWAMENVHDVRVRLTQDGAAGTDHWFVDSMAIFNDPMMWEISRDGGVTWYEMIGIKNDPRGVFVFPELPPTDRTGGTQLRWRITGYAPDLSVSSVVLRPWYATFSGAVPYQDTLQASGAAGSLADYYPRADLDPLFQGWQNPIPQEWWLASRQWLQQNNPPTEPLPAITLPEAVAEGTDEGNPPSPARHILPDAFVING